MKIDFKKAIKSEIAQEEKDEDTRVRHAIKDISLTTKDQHKAHKAIRKADSTVAKLGKKESVATAAVQKATHEHDIAVTNLRSAQRDAQLKRQEDARLQRELEEKKTRLDTALREQKVHKHGRESRLLELDDERNVNRAADSSAVGAGLAGAAGHHGPHPIGAQGANNDVGIGTNAGTRSVDNTALGRTGNVPGQYGTGAQAHGTRAGGPGYADHPNAEGVATGAGLVGHDAHRGITEQGYDNDRIRDSDGPGVGQTRTARDQATYEPPSVAGVETGTDAVERSIGRDEGYPTHGNFRQTNLEPQSNAGQPAIHSEGGPFGAIDNTSTQPRHIGHPGDDSIRVARGVDTGFPRGGAGECIGPGNVHTAGGLNQDVGAGGQTISGHATGYASATSGAGYSGAGGENLNFREDPMLGSSGTGADPGIRSGGTRQFGGRGGSRELIGERNVGLGEPRYGAEPIGDHQYTQPGTGIGGRQGIDEEAEFNRDRMVMGGTNRLGSGIKQTGSIDSEARGPMIGNQRFGEDSMPGGYPQGAGSGRLDNVKEHF